MKGCFNALIESLADTTLSQSVPEATGHVLAQMMDPKTVAWAPKFGCALVATTQSEPYARMNVIAICLDRWESHIHQCDSISFCGSQQSYVMAPPAVLLFSFLFNSCIPAGVVELFQLTTRFSLRPSCSLDSLFHLEASENSVMQGNYIRSDGLLQLEALGGTNGWNVDSSYFCPALFIRFMAIHRNIQCITRLPQMLSVLHGYLPFRTCMKNEKKLYHRRGNWCDHTSVHCFKFQFGSQCVIITAFCSQNKLTAWGQRVISIMKRSPDQTKY